MAKNTVDLRGKLDIVEEFGAASAITPGFLIELASATTVQAHSTQDGEIFPMVALESALEGKEITDAYAADDKVRSWVPTRGDIGYLLLANGETASAGSFLTSNGDGYVKVLDIQSGGVEKSNQIIGIALEAVDMSDSSGADPNGRIQVMFI